jgi:hypothetical protein
MGRACWVWFRLWQYWGARHLAPAHNTDRVSDTTIRARAMATRKAQSMGGAITREGSATARRLAAILRTMDTAEANTGVVRATAEAMHQVTIAINTGDTAIADFR